MPTSGRADGSTAAPAPDPLIAPNRRPTKKALLTSLLHRPKGAAVSDLIAATGWQKHSVRAALTGLRQDGHAIIRSKAAGGATHYRIAPST
jgi:hypothetical protein